jgi:L-asparaginase
MTTRPKVAVIGTGGTIASLGAGPFDLLDYGATGTKLEIGELIARFPELHEVADIIPIRYKAAVSMDLHFPDWKQIVLICDRVAAEHSDLAGIVVVHGTATLEETAYVLNLTAKVHVPIVVLGAQRPANAMSSDAGLNLANAIRVASAPEARGLGALVVLNDEIHAAREVTKTSTFRLHTFRSPDFGILGHADADTLAFYRRPSRRVAPDTEFDIRDVAALPRVDITYAYAGSDGTAVRAFVAAGAMGIVSAGFAPGSTTTDEYAALREAVAHGIVVVQSTRVGSGRTYRRARLREAGIHVADNLNPQKARILLALALTRSADAGEIERIFRTY